MFCPQCGKEIDPKSRFCYMCGAPVVIPKEKKEEDEPGFAQEEVPQVAKEEFVPFARKSVKPAPSKPMPSEDAEDDEEIDFKPQARTARSAYARPAEEETTAVRQERLRAEMPGAQEEYHPHLSREAQGIPYVSAKRMKAKSMYADEEPEDDYDTGTDDYDAYDDYDNGDENDYDYEEPEEEGFFRRHAVGLFTLLLLIIVLAVGGVYLMSDSGQVLLARANIAWKHEAYAMAGTQAYQEENYLSAGSYYEKALKMDPQNYDYAYRSAVSYYNGDDAADAEKMSRSAIALNPDSADAYIILQHLYPDANTRPQEITELLQQGYTRTGDSAIIGR